MGKTPNPILGDTITGGYMSHSHCHLATHIIFATKNRQTWLKTSFRQNLFAYIGGTITQIEGHRISINGVEDHLHILCLLPKEKSISEFVRIVKASSSKWIHENHNAEFSWQEGYGAFAVSISNIEQVKEYIENQEEHHKKIDYQKEMNKYLKAHGFPIIGIESKSV
jgi:putative transposase